MEVRKASRILQRLGSAGRKVQSKSGRVPSDVPKGHLAVYVGIMEQTKRFVIPAQSVNHPLFRALLDKAEEQFGFGHQGPLLIPCDPLIFHNVLCLLRNNSKPEIEQLIMELQK
ncbi:auxin-induced protein X15-like [Cryptomeria japonica]|uniref:auxin-induced protein X15-like n=1 Tax=Cryptomeria japonica TaxID=3369 RepID=UPI0025AD3CA3|nr:auxin-induced protein X15-like [Cryptomeria japonica]